MLDYYQQGIGESGWGSISNLLFPQSSPVTIKSESTQPAGGTGQTFRFTPPENQSMIETNWFSSLGWIGSPYQADKAVPAKVQESQQLAASVETKDPIGGSLDWAIDTKIKAVTYYDKIKALFGLREVISETPRAGSAEGKDVQHTNDLQDRSAVVVPTGKQLNDQSKGLFNLGYPQTQPQPAAAVEHELTPKKLLPFGIGTIAIGILLLLLLGK